jgi:hypothetical protein
MVVELFRAVVIFWGDATNIRLLTSRPPLLLCFGMEYDDADSPSLLL